MKVIWQMQGTLVYVGLLSYSQKLGSQFCDINKHYLKNYKVFKTSSCPVYVLIIF